MSLTKLWYAEPSNEQKLTEEQYEIINTFIELFVIKYLKWERPTQLTAKIVYKNVLQLCKLKWFNNILYFKRSLHEMISWSLIFHYNKTEKLIKLVNGTKEKVVNIFSENEKIDDRISPEINHKLNLLAQQAIREDIIILDSLNALHYIENSIYPISTKDKDYLWEILAKKYIELVKSNSQSKIAC